VGESVKRVRKREFAVSRVLTGVRFVKGMWNWCVCEGFLRDETHKTKRNLQSVQMKTENLSKYCEKEDKKKMVSLEVRWTRIIKQQSIHRLWPIKNTSFLQVRCGMGRMVRFQVKIATNRKRGEEFLCWWLRQCI